GAARPECVRSACARGACGSGAAAVAEGLHDLRLAGPRSTGGHQGERGAERDEPTALRDLAALPNSPNAWSHQRPPKPDAPSELTHLYRPTQRGQFLPLERVGGRWGLGDGRAEIRRRLQVVG